MSRVVRAIVGVALIAATVVTAGGTAPGLAAFLASSVAGSLAFSLGTSLVLGAALETIAGRPNTAGAGAQGIRGNIRGTTEAHNIVLGRARVGGVIQNFGTSGNSNRFLWLSIAHSITHRGGADRIGRVWLDDTEITEAQMTQSTVNDTLGVPMLRYTVTGGKFAGLVQITFRRGTSNQGADPDLSVIGGLSTDYARGVAMTTVRLLRDVDNEEAFIAAFQGRIPVVSVELYGNRVYDPRLDTTAGGSGTQRVNDPLTWTWSDNPALCAATYSIMSQADGGEGVLTTDINWSSVAAAATVCDQAVTGGGQLFRCSALLTTARERRSNVGLLLDAMQGARAEVGGLYVFYAGTWRTPTFAITEDWLRGPPVIEPKRPLEDLYNYIRVTSLDSAENYNKKESPPYVNATFEAQDGGRRLVREVDFPTCPTPAQAQRMAAILGRKSRRQMTVTVPLKWIGMNLELWETGTIDLPGLALASRTFRITGLSISEDGPNVTLQEDASADYGDITPQAVTPYTPPEPVLGAPPALTSLTAVGTTDGIELSWVVSQAYRDESVVVFRKPGAPGAAGTYTARATTFGTTWRDVDTGGQTYSYKVVTRLRNGAVSPDSNVASATAIVPVDPALQNRIELAIAIDGTINAGRVNTASFAAGIQPVTVVATLPNPVGYTGPRTVFLTTDNKLYRYTGTAWTTEVTSGDLAANSVIAGKIAAAAVSTDQLAANAVTASKIFIGDLTNYVRNSDFIYDTVDARADGWSAGVLVRDSTGALATGSPKARYATVTVRDNSGMMVPCTAGERFYVSCFAREAAGNTHTFTFVVWFRGPTGASLAFAVPFTAPVGTANWTFFEGFVTAPAGAASLTPYPLLSSGAGVQVPGWGFAAPVIRRAASGELIVDGAITTRTLQANSITTEKIVVGAATAAVSATGVVDDFSWPTATSSLTVNTSTVGFTSTGAPRKIFCEVGVEIGSATTTALPTNTAFVLLTYGPVVAGTPFLNRVVRIPTSVRSGSARTVNFQLTDLLYTAAPTAGTQQIGFRVTADLFDSTGAAVNVTAAGTTLRTRSSFVIEENKV